MINKQIIDVCPYQGECSVSGCKRNDDGCFVRQLFEERYKAERELYRKDQECKRLKEEIAEIRKYQYEQDFLQQQLDQLKAENKDLQEQIRKHNDDMFKNPPEKRSYCKGCTLPYVSKKFKQTLTEIKEIIEQGVKIHDDIIVSKQILQKISEVLNEKQN